MMRLSLLLTFLATASAFVAPRHSPRMPLAPLAAAQQPNHLATSLTVGAAFVAANWPALVQAAAEVDDYEYGSVDAPIGLAIGGGILAIATALLPIALKGGEEAFEEIRERDSTTFGAKSNKDVLKKRK